MLRQTLNDDLDGNCLYEPKLTRAKIRLIIYFIVSVWLDEVLKLK
jgi:hypothetical protein